MICVVRSGIGNIVQDFFSIQAVPLRDSKESNRSESALGVDVKAFSFSAAHVHRQLTCYGECMAQLRLPRPKFTEKLSNCTSLDTT